MSAARPVPTGRTSETKKKSGSEDPGNEIGFGGTPIMDWARLETAIQGSPRLRVTPGTTARSTFANRCNPTTDG